MWGGTLALPGEIDLFESGILARWLRQEQIQCCCLNPTLVDFLASEGHALLPDLRLVFCVGSAFTWAHADVLQHLAPSARLVNLYGSTETQRAVTCYELPQAEAGGSRPPLVPLGRGMRGVQALVLKANRQLALPYEIGEIALRSPYVALGYYSDATLSAKKFVRGLLDAEDEVPTYLTGDYGYLSPHLGLQFVGRRDTQQKVNGFRVDTEQLDAACRALPHVKQSLSVVSEVSGVASLITFLVAEDAFIQMNTSTVRSKLEKLLPREMVPAYLEPVEQLPRTLNGKYDVARLLQDFHQRHHSALPHVLQTSTSTLEQEISTLLLPLLPEPRVEPTVPLFELGLSSLRFLSFVSQLRIRFGDDLKGLGLHSGLSLQELCARLHQRWPKEVQVKGRTELPSKELHLPIEHFGAVSQVSESSICFGSTRFAHLCSNSYLGLNQDPTLHARLAQFVQSSASLSSHGSAGLNGFTQPHANLVEQLKQVYACESILLFSSASLANLSTIANLATPADQLLVDEQCHHSIWQGCQLSGAQVLVYSHNDVGQLRQLLSSSAPPDGGQRIILTEAVFSISGETLALPEVVQLSEEFGCLLYVDEACSLGHIGAHGLGIEDAFGGRRCIDLRVGTLAKALLSSGGYLACSEALARRIRGRGGDLFSTAIPPIQAFLAAEALAMLRARGAELVAQLSEVAQLWREGLRAAGFDIGDSRTAIVPVWCANEQEWHTIYERFSRAMLYTLPLSPTWGSKRYGLRTSVTAAHQRRDLEAALGALVRYGKEC